MPLHGRVDACTASVRACRSAGEARRSVGTRDAAIDKPDAAPDRRGEAIDKSRPPIDKGWGAIDKRSSPIDKPPWALDSPQEIPDWARKARVVASGREAHMKVEGVSRQILAETPARAIALLRGVRLHAGARHALVSAGYTQAAHDEGVRLVASVLGVELARTTSSDAAAVAHREAVDAALTECDAFVESDLRRARAALAHRHPTIESWVFETIDATPIESNAFRLTLFCDRLDALLSASPSASVSSAELPATEAERRDAVAVLESRGFTREHSAKMRERAEVALGKTRGAPPAPAPSESQAAEDETEMLALRKWYAEWADTAHAVVTSRAALIDLGLAHRKRGDDQAAPEG